MSSPCPTHPGRRRAGPTPTGRAGSLGLSLALHSGILLAATSLPLLAPRGSESPRAGARVALVSPPAEEWIEELEEETPPTPIEPQRIEQQPALEPVCEPPPQEPSPEPEPEPPSPEWLPLPSADRLWARLGTRRLFSAPDATAEALRAELETPDAPELPGDPPVETTPEPLAGWCPAPTYPARAERAGWQGLVVLRLWIDETGRVVRATIESSSGHAVLDRAALDAVRNWRFRPGTRAGRPALMDWVQRISFEL